MDDCTCKTRGIGKPRWDSECPIHREPPMPDSEKHTAEKTWTPEPWERVEEEGGGLHVDRSDANRAVACVNACAGLPSDWLEQGKLAELHKGLLELASIARSRRHHGLQIDPDRIEYLAALLPPEPDDE